MTNNESGCSVISKKGIVLLFGAFNPFTNAHLLIGKLAKDRFPYYEICYVPSRINYMLEWKGMSKDSVMSEKLRYDLIKGSIENLKDFTVTDIELNGGVNGKTYNTVNYFRETLGYTDVVLCFGTDKVSELETWYKGKDLIKENHFLIITRSGDSLNDKMTEYTTEWKDNFSELKNDLLTNLSASKIRDALSSHDWSYVKENVPEYVYKTLDKEQYY